FGDVPSPALLDWKTLRVESFESDKQVYRVTAQLPSFFVRTMRKWNGWKALVDGAEAPIAGYLGVLPAVKLAPGTHRVEWQYAPRAWPQGIGLSALGVLLAAGAVLWDKRRAKPGSST